MSILLRESDVEALVGVEDAFEVVEEALRAHGLGQAENHPRQRVFVPGGVLQVMAGGIPDEPGATPPGPAATAPGTGATPPEPGAAGPVGPVVGFKAYTAFAGKVRFVVMLFSARDGRLLALMEADRLGQLRTGAASGVAARYMARADARTLGVIGSGWQAETQVMACCLARPIERALIYSRDPARREAFARRLREIFRSGRGWRGPAGDGAGIPTGAGVGPRRNVEVLAVESPAAAVEPADVVVTITASRTPVFDGASVRPGQMIIGAGSNHARRVELPAGVANRCAVIAVDDLAQAQVESGDLIAAVERGETSWDRVVEVGRVVAGKTPGRTSEQDITLFESHGLAIWDVALARRVYERAIAAGRGEPLRLWADA